MRSPYGSIATFWPDFRCRGSRISLGMTTWNFGEMVTVLIGSSILAFDHTAIILYRNRSKLARTYRNGPLSASTSAGGAHTFLVNSLGGVWGFLGDLNGDGQATILDLQRMVNCLLGLETNARADVTGDTRVDILDLQTLVNKLLGV